ncbi:MAG: PLxRFG domain-containing protein, partial [Thiohalocapsa sp.]
MGEPSLPGMQRYDALRRGMEADRSLMMEEAGEFAEDVWAPWVYGGRDRPLQQHVRPKVRADAKALFDLIHQATLANEDPAEAHKPLSIQMPLGPGFPPTKLDVTPEQIADLTAKARRWARSEADRNRGGYTTAAIAMLKQLLPAEKTRQKARPALLAQWKKLSRGEVHDNGGKGWDRKEAADQARAEIDKTEQRPTMAVQRDDGRWVVQAFGAQEIYRHARDLYKDRSQKRFDALVQRIRDSSALEAPAKDKLIAQMRVDFESSVTPQGKIKVEPYFPLYRQGQYYVSAVRYQGGAPGPRREGKNAGELFATEDAAYTASRKRPDLLGVRWWAEEKQEDGGWELVEIGERFFGRYTGPGESRKARGMLRADGYVDVTNGMIKESVKQIEGVTEAFVAEAVERMRKSGDEEGADLLHQLYLQQLHETSMRTHYIHRKGVAGFEDNALAAFGNNMFHQAHQIAKLRHGQRLVDQLRVMEENKDEIKDKDRADAYLRELRQRHQWVMSPENASWTNKTSALGFFWYLGLTPGAALVNLTQTPIVAYPTLAAKFDDWGGASKQMLRALGDVRRGMGKKEVLSYAKGKAHPSLPANLTAEERLAFEAWTLAGARDVTRAHNLAG